MGNHYPRKKGDKSIIASFPRSPALPIQLRNTGMSFLPAVPITTLDGGIAPEASSIATSLRRQFPTVLLMECMLERICVIYETDPEKQKELYDAVRTIFVNYRLLPPHEGFPEMDGIRLRIGSDLNNLFRRARQEIAVKRGASATSSGPLVAASSLMNRSLWSSADGNEHLFTSRYEMDFEELEFIASGGFGVVYRARNNLDQNEYAIKKIIIRPRSANRIIREVQLLSLLHHPNIVAYKSAWLEYCPPQTFHEIIRRIEGESFSSSKEASSFSLVSSYSRARETVVSNSTYHRNIESDASSNSDDSVVFESETVTETCTETSTRSVEGAVQQRWSHENRIVSSSVVLLYIQMQLCSQTLRQWLNERNATLKNIAWSTKGIDLELSIFRQIVKGINYVHNSNIIHRDIKPENIFIDKTTNKVQIGDFGLAKLGFNNGTEISCLAVATPVAHSATRGVGTHSYAAPEQLNSKESDAKSDIYSLGIVLMELLRPFKTEMERYKSIDALRNGNYLSKTLRSQWPHLASLILDMVSTDCTKRPSAAQILERLDVPVATTNSEMKEDANQSVPELLAIIADLKRQLALKETLIRQLSQESSSS